MIISVLDINECNNSQLQVDSVSLLNNLFINNSITNVIVKSYCFEGVRGKFDKLKNYCICFEFSYFNYKFEFYLSYDQLEYYIIKEGKILKECNLEDFWEESIMIEKFMIHLKKNLTSLDIPFNE